MPLDSPPLFIILPGCPDSAARGGAEWFGGMLAHAREKKKKLGGGGEAFAMLCFVLLWLQDCQTADGQRAAQGKTVAEFWVRQLVACLGLG